MKKMIIICLAVLVLSSCSNRKFVISEMQVVSDKGQFLVVKISDINITDEKAHVIIKEKYPTAIIADATGWFKPYAFFVAIPDEESQ